MLTSQQVPSPDVALCLNLPDCCHIGWVIQGAVVNHVFVSSFGFGVELAEPSRKGKPIRLQVACMEVVYCDMMSRASAAVYTARKAGIAQSSRL
jgi:hypothetical protein